MMFGEKSSFAIGIILTIVVGVVEILVPILLALSAKCSSLPSRRLRPLKGSCYFLVATRAGNICRVNGYW